MMEPPAEYDAEFQAWYDTEHMPQRRAMPGFLSAARWQCVEGRPQWLALYDLESLSALETPEYLAVAGDRSTPWTRRILGLVKGYRRVAAGQIEPGNALAFEDVRRLLVAKFEMKETSERLRGAEGLLQLRVFECTAGPHAGFWAIAEFRDIVTVSQADEAVWNVYTPYNQRD